MPAERVPMRFVREILRLKAEGLSDRSIALSTGLARSTIRDYLARAGIAGLIWPLPEGLGETALEDVLFARAGSKPGQRRKPEPEWAVLHRELRRPGVTLQLLWQEYRGQWPEGYGYSRFCDLYETWRRCLSPTMRQAHPAGERLFVDYAGQTVEVIEGGSGEVHRAQVFVAVLGASSYTYAEATLTQGLPDWIGAHGRALAFFGGVPRQIVPDNLKAGVTKADWHEPVLNATYQDFAAHYGTAILPARPRRPRDKAKVEVGVQVVERWILARLRHQRFFSLGELNAAIRGLLAALNERPMRHLGVSRRQLFEELDRPALAALPLEPYVYAEWRRRRVGIDYHVEIDGHYYSAPHRLLRQEVEARISERTVELFHKGQRVACHVLGVARGRQTTSPEHMPSSHRRHAGWTHERILQEAAAIGAGTGASAAVILRSRPHPEQGFRACLGILRLARRYGPDRLEAACRRGLGIGARSYGSIASILDKGLDRQPLPSAAPPEAPPDHPNIRGSRYYH